MLSAQTWRTKWLIKAFLTGLFRSSVSACDAMWSWFPMMIVIALDLEIVFMNLRLSKSTSGYSMAFSSSVRIAVPLSVSGAPVTMILISKSFPTLTSADATRMRSA